MRHEPRSDRRPSRPAATLSELRRLVDDRRQRDRRGLYFVEGVRNFVAAVDHRAAFEVVVHSERLLVHALARKLVRRLRRAGVPTRAVTPEEFRSVSRMDRASGIAVVLRQRTLRLDRLEPGDSTCWTVLRRVRSPGNLGCLMRTSAAVGGAGFVLLGDEVDPYDPAVVRASMGALFGQRLVRASASELAAWTRRQGLLAVGASPDGARAYDELAWRRPALIVLGEERAGLDEEQRQLCDELVRIPMRPGCDSLNLSVAGGLLMYEALRAGGRRAPAARTRGPPADEKNGIETQSQALRVRFWSRRSTMIVCHCTGARDQDIQSAAERGVRSVAEIGQQCGAGACCGGCLPLIRELLSAPAAAARAPVPPAHPEPAPEH